MLCDADLKPHQHDLIDALARYVIIDGGVGTYKTTACILRLYLHCFEWPGSRIIVGAQTFQQLKDVFLTEWQDQVPETHYDYNAQDHIITLPLCNGRIYLRYADHPRAHQVITGMSISGYYLIQAESLRDSRFLDVLNERVRHGNPAGHLRLLDCNPGAPTHFVHRRFIDRSHKEHLRDVAHVHVVTTPETSKYTQDDLDEWKRTLSPEAYRRRVLGEWCAGEGAVYSEWQVEPSPTPDQVLQYWVGIDPGHGKHEFGIVWIGELAENQFMIIDECKGKLQSHGMDHIADLIRARCLKWGEDKLGYCVVDWHDNVYRRTLNQFYDKLNAIYHPHGRRSAWFGVDQGVVLMEQALRKGILQVSSECPETQKELNSYVNDDAGKPDKSAFDPHLLDAARYDWIRIFHYSAKIGLYSKGEAA